ncbi:hypothetical protein V8E36_002840 [Tilletia maclaganii]
MTSERALSLPVWPLPTQPIAETFPANPLRPSYADVLAGRGDVLTRRAVAIRKHVSTALIVGGGPPAKTAAAEHGRGVTAGADSDSSLSDLDSELIFPEKEGSESEEDELESKSAAAASSPVHTKNTSVSEANKTKSTSKAPAESLPVFPDGRTGAGGATLWKRLSTTGMALVRRPRFGVGAY